MEEARRRKGVLYGLVLASLAVFQHVTGFFLHQSVGGRRLRSFVWMNTLVYIDSFGSSKKLLQQWREKHQTKQTASAEEGSFGGDDLKPLADDHHSIPGYHFHHYAIKTKNIFNALKFYSLLGMEEKVRFKTGAARAAWIEGVGVRLELIEVPEFMAPEGRAADLSADANVAVLGLNHAALDVTAAARACLLREQREGEKEEDRNENGAAVSRKRGEAGAEIWAFLRALNAKSEAAFQKSVRLAIRPYRQMIMNEVFDIAFISDPDGTLIELLFHVATLEHEMLPDW